MYMGISEGGLGGRVIGGGVQRHSAAAVGSTSLPL